MPAPAPVRAPLADTDPPVHDGAVATEGAPTRMDVKESRQVAAWPEVNAAGPPAATVQPWKLHI